MNDELQCSFCRKTKKTVRVLIAGAAGAFICENCVELCAKIVSEELPFDGKWGASCNDDNHAHVAEERK